VKGRLARTSAFGQSGTKKRYHLHVTILDLVISSTEWTLLFKKLMFLLTANLSYPILERSTQFKARVSAAEFLEQFWSLLCFGLKAAHGARSSMAVRGPMSSHILRPPK
jgi:hypothetical protein